MASVTLRSLGKLLSVNEVELRQLFSLIALSKLQTITPRHNT